MGEKKNTVFIRIFQEKLVSYVIDSKNNSTFLYILTFLKQLLIASASQVAAVDTFGKIKSRPSSKHLRPDYIPWNTVFQASLALRNICYTFILKWSCLDVKNRLTDKGGERKERVRWMDGVASGIYTTICRTDCQWEFELLHPTVTT